MEIDNYYESINSVTKNIPKYKVMVVTGDFNVYLGTYLWHLYIYDIYICTYIYVVIYDGFIIDKNLTI